MKEVTETVLHYYKFWLDSQEKCDEYQALRDKLKAMGLKCFDSISSTHSTFYENQVKPLDGKVIHLETKHLFDNQWNCAEGLRVFDWSEAIYPAKKLKQGMWLEQTQEMIDIRHNTWKCGYCGAMAEEPGFCDKCLGSEYLEPKLLLLLNRRRIDDGRRGCKELTPEELAYIMPRYEIAQGLGKEDREKKARSKLRTMVQDLIPEAAAKGEALLDEAVTKGLAYTWLLDNHFRDLDNVIYYNHTGIFGFGWRDAYGAKEAAELREFLKYFPGKFEVKSHGK